MFRNLKDTYTKRNRNIRKQQRQQRQIAHIKGNKEILQVRQELLDEFMVEHPELQELSEKELYQKMAEHGEQEREKGRRHLRNHIEMFSDAVIAIIITIMLLEVPVPTGIYDYGSFAESVGIFLVSFTVAANFWFNHHKNLAVTDELSESIIVADFGFMALLGLLPLLTRWLMEDPSWLASLNYGGVILFTLLLQEGMSYLISYDRMKNKPKTMKFWRRVWLMRLFVVLMVNIIIMCFAIYNPLIGRWIFVAVPIVSFIMRSFKNDSEDFTINLEEAKVDGRPRF